MIKNAFKRVTIFHESRGISLLEAVFTLLIIAAMILATVAYFRQAEHQTQTTALLSEVKGIIQAAEEYNNANGSFAGITVRDIAAAHTIVPRYNVVGTENITGGGFEAGYLVDPWSGLGADNNFTTAGITVGISGSDTSHLLIKINQLPSFACEQVLNQLTQFMDLAPDPGESIKAYCVRVNSRDKFTTLGQPFSFTYPKREVISE